MLPTIEWQDGAVVMIDQRKLPAEEAYVRCRTPREVARAIRSMVIRGAPAIGVAAAMGLALGVRRSRAKGSAQLAAEFYKLCELLAATRPTAVNLFWAIERMKERFAAAVRAGRSPAEIAETLVGAAQQIHDDDVASCRALGAHGAETLINRRSRTWREIPEEDRDISSPEAAAALAVANPRLVKRPVIDLGGRSLVGFGEDARAAIAGGQG